VYASEGLRGVLAPQVRHMPFWAVGGALTWMDLILLVVGLKKFEKKAVG